MTETIKNDEGPVEEKRLFPRFPANLRVDLEFDGNRYKKNNYLIDVSLGGIALYTEKELKSDDEVLLRIPSEEPCFEGYGEVAWVRQKENGYQVGIRFINMTGTSIDSLHQLLQKVREG